MVAIIQIPNMPAVVALSGIELFETVQAGTSCKVTLNQIAAYAQGTAYPELTFSTPLVRTLNNVALTTVPVTLGGTGATKFGVVTAKTAAYPIVLNDNLTTFTITGAVGAVPFTLPVPVGGEEFQFVVSAARLLTVIAGAGGTIALGELVSTVAGNVSCDGAAGGLYGMISLKALSSTLWVTTSYVGPWSVA